MASPKQARHFFRLRLNQSLVPRLQIPHQIELFRSRGRIFRYSDDLFGETSWMQVMFGQGIEPRGYHPLTDGTSEAEIAKMLGNVKAVIGQVVSNLQTHQQFIDTNCKAAALV